jgi:hypothetical protein
VEQLLDKTELGVAPHERRFEADSSPLAATRGDNTERAPNRDGLALSFQLACAGVLVRDRSLGRAARALADEHGSRLRERLDPRRGVDEIAGDHALAFGADRHRGFAREHCGSGAKVRDSDLLAEGGDRGHEIESGADGALGVVLARDRRSPHSHNGVADELLDGSAEALDDEARALEVTRQQLAHVLRVALIRERRVADEVGEQDGDEATFGCR